MIRQARPIPTDPASRLPTGPPDPAGNAAPEVGRLALRLDDLARSLGVSRRALERLRSAGRFPRPDAIIGRMPLWRPETIRAWLERGGRP